MPGIPQIYQDHVNFDLLGQANDTGAMIVLDDQPGGGKSALLRARSPTMRRMATFCYGLIAPRQQKVGVRLRS